MVVVKIAVQPASQSWPMETRLVLPREGNKWVVLAAVGSCGRLSSAVCVDCIVVPSGRATWMPLLLICLFVWGALSDMKWPVAPVSNYVLLGWGWGGT